MKKFLGLWLLVLALAPPFAHAELNDFLTHTFQAAAAATGNGTDLTVDKFTTVAVTVTITNTATVTFEGTQDGTNYASKVCISTASTSGTLSTTATASGVYQCNVAGLQSFRVRVSDWTSGTVTATGRATTAVFGGASGAGGASGITVAEEDGDPSVASVTTLTVPNGLLTDDGSGAVSLASPTVTLSTAFTGGKTITGANSLANAVRIGDGVSDTCHFTDASLGPQVRPCTDANVRQLIPINFTGGVYDEEGAAMIETIDPDAATPQGIWTYGTAYKPLKSIWVPAGALSTDGTQCAAPAEVTINSGAKMWTVICTDNDSSTAYANIEMPDSWDGGTITVMGSFIQTAADTSNMNSDVAAACRADGITVNNTWGTEVAMDTAMTGSSAKDVVTTTAVTPNGTCTGAGTMLQLRWQLDATGTTTAVATLHLLGFKINYKEKSRSS
jgi:hypothetical protein